METMYARVMLRKESLRLTSEVQTSGLQRITARSERLPQANASNRPIPSWHHNNGLNIKYIC
jgi:hypothetical protein